MELTLMDFSSEKIAFEMRLQDQTVKNKRMECRKKLRELIEADEIGYNQIQKWK